MLSKGAHHLNLFVTVITQNLYAPGKHTFGMFGMSRNYQYMVLFRNLADIRFIKMLGQRWLGDARIKWVYASVWTSHISSLWLFGGIYYHQETPEETHFRFSILLDELVHRV